MITIHDIPARRRGKFPAANAHLALLRIRAFHEVAGRQADMAAEGCLHTSLMYALFMMRHLLVAVYGK
ncbi:hypothetical protein [Mesorhizobium sp. KR2-14]|uniref:hypothetical protein n=1 Tax=Mesorhizobium sp. KR2-14 TaxID=3156610 RepID=UPI0032B53BD0